MNKFVVLILAAALLIGIGIGYKSAFGGNDGVDMSGGVVKRFTVTAVKDEWRFTPADLKVFAGDTVELTVINEDDYDHGIAIDAYGISQRMPANSTINITFTATKPGDFPMYCSVPCGEGHVDGKKRTHFDMISTLHVAETTTDKVKQVEEAMKEK